MQNNTDTQVYAGFFVRLAAYIIDWIIVGTVLLFVKIPIWTATMFSPDNFLVKDFIFKYSIRDILLYVLGVTYFILLTYFTGATLGKRAMRLRVVSSENRDLTFFEVAYRETVGRFLSEIIIFIGYFMIGPDSKKRALHDRLADTRVVYRHVKEVYIPAEIQYQYAMPVYSNTPCQGGAGSNIVPTQPAAMQAQAPNGERNAGQELSHQPQQSPTEEPVSRNENF